MAQPQPLVDLKNKQDGIVKQATTQAAAKNNSQTHFDHLSKSLYKILTLIAKFKSNKLRNKRNKNNLCQIINKVMA